MLRHSHVKHKSVDCSHTPSSAKTWALESSSSSSQERKRERDSILCVRRKNKLLSCTRRAVHPFSEQFTRYDYHQCDMEGNRAPLRPPGLAPSKHLCRRDPLVAAGRPSSMQVAGCSVAISQTDTRELVPVMILIIIHTHTHLQRGM